MSPHEELQSQSQLVGNVLRLSLPTKSQFKEMKEMLSDPETFPWLNSDDRIQEEDWLALRVRLTYIRDRIRVVNDMACSVEGSRIKYLQQAARPTQLPFVIRSSKDQKLGVIILKISIMHQVGWIRTVILPEFRGNQYGTKAKCLILQLAFDHLGLRKVVSELLAINGATRAINRKLGFQVEGRQKKHALVNGNPEDVLSMALMREDWATHLRSKSHRNDCDGKLKVSRRRLWL